MLVFVLVLFLEEVRKEREGLDLVGLDYRVIDFFGIRWFMWFFDNRLFLKFLFGWIFLNYFYFLCIVIIYYCLKNIGKVTLFFLDIFIRFLVILVKIVEVFLKNNLYVFLEMKINFFIFLGRIRLEKRGRWLGRFKFNVFG